MATAETIPHPEKQKPVLSDSAFNMLRCIVCVAHADRKIRNQEVLFIRTLLSFLKQTVTVTPAQIAQLRADLKSKPPVTRLLPGVTDPADREHLLLFAGLLARADGEVTPREEAILNKIYNRMQELAAGGAGVSPLTEMTPEHAAMAAFAEEARKTIKRENFGRTLATSGIGPGAGPLAIADAFMEKGSIPPLVDVKPVEPKPPWVSPTMRRALQEEEKVIARARFHIIYMLVSVFGGVFIGLLGAPAGELLRAAIIHTALDSVQYYTDIYNALNGFITSHRWETWPPLVSWTLGSCFCFWRMLRQWTTEIVLTTRRMLFKRGIWHVDFDKVDLRQLNQVEVVQNRIGNLLDYGSIYMYSTPFGRMERDISLPQVAEPHLFSNAIDRARRVLATTGGM